MKINIKGIVKGAILSLIITLVLIFIIALLSYFTNIGENIITVFAYASVIIGILAGSVLVSMSAPNKKFIHVMLVCTTYTVVLIAASAVLNGNITFNAHIAAVIGGIFAASFLGLVIGNR